MRRGPCTEQETDTENCSNTYMRSAFVALKQVVRRYWPKTMEDEINHILSRAETKFCTPNGGACTSKTIGLLVRRHMVAGEFHYIGKEASTRWGRAHHETGQLSVAIPAGGSGASH